MLRIVALAIAFVPLAAAGCGTPRPAAPDVDQPRDTVATAPPTLDAPFALARGATASIDGLEVTFSTVVEDSRCPLDVTCVWEGRATVNLEVAQSGRSGGINLTLPGGTSRDDAGRHPTVETLGHFVTLMALDPYPGSEGAADGDVPRVTLKVSRER